jgi:hypothetical protein
VALACPKLVPVTRRRKVSSWWTRKPASCSSSKESAGGLPSSFTLRAEPPCDRNPDAPFHEPHRPRITPAPLRTVLQTTRWNVPGGASSDSVVVGTASALKPLASSSAFTVIGQQLRQ